MRSEGYSSWVCLSACLSVCPCSNSLLDGLFVPQTIRRNKRVIRIRNMCSKVREKQNIVLSDQATKRMRVSKATKRASETSEQTLHRQLISGTTHAQFAEGLHFSAFHLGSTGRFDACLAACRERHCRFLG